ncbi:hypothetical protein ES708_31300 [subsurface metagenome]
MAVRRPQGAQHPEAIIGRMSVDGPVTQQILQNRVQLLFRGIPGFHQVVIQSQLIDTLDSGLGVAVSS